MTILTLKHPMEHSTMYPFAENQTFYSERLSQLYSGYVSKIPSFELKQAMLYALENTGKLLRPQLVYAAGHIFNASLGNMDLPASAMEVMHTYSLIHDDLPCMDNADLRRNKETCHRVFGESIAVLTGDALQTLAIQIIAHHPSTLSVKQRLDMIATLSVASGALGMAAGQAIDMNLSGNISESLLLEMYRLKTGALFTACLELGRLSSNNNNEQDKAALHCFGDCVGLAFQIQDDLLDMQKDTHRLGKTAGIDAKNNKMTYPVLFGVEKAETKMAALYDCALESINHFGHHANDLRGLTQYLLSRDK